MHRQCLIPVFNYYSPAVRYYPLNYPIGYEPPEWERFEEQFHPPWLRQLERRMGFAPGQEPLWWERLEEQFEPPWLQRLERQLGIPQPYDPRYDYPRF